MSGFSDSKRAALREFEQRYDETARLQSLLPAPSPSVSVQPSSVGFSRRPRDAYSVAPSVSMAHGPPVSTHPYGPPLPYGVPSYGQPPMLPGPYSPPGFAPVRRFFPFLALPHGCGVYFLLLANPTRMDGVWSGSGTRSTAGTSLAVPVAPLRLAPVGQRLSWSRLRSWLSIVSR